MIRRVAFAVAVTLSVSSVASAQGLRASVAKVAVQSARTWQDDYDDALTRKQDAKNKIWIGGAAAVASIFLGLTAGSDTDECVADIAKGTKPLGTKCGSTRGKLAIVTGVGGAGVMTWGLIEYGQAKEDIRALEARRPTNRTALITLNEHHALGVSIGRRSNFTYQLTW